MLDFVLRTFHGLLHLTLTIILQSQYSLWVSSQSLCFDPQSLLFPSRVHNTMLDPFTNIPFLLLFGILQGQTSSFSLLTGHVFAATHICEPVNI